MIAPRLHLRRRQSFALDRLARGEILSVERGCVLLQAPASDGRSRIALVLFAGDVISRDAAPPIPGMGLTATGVATLSRGNATGDAARGGEVPDLVAAFGRLAARTALHAIVLSQLTAEERLTSFLVEMALRFGTRTPAGFAVELPLSRTDLAHYLALNPDTMSRLMSRLKASGLIVAPTRGWLTVPSLDALAARTPLAETLQRLWTPGEYGAPLEAVRSAMPSGT